MRFLTAGLLFLSACDLAALAPEFGHRRFVNLRPMDPVPHIYFAAWHAEVGVCMGMTADYARIEWRQADAIYVNGRSVRGLWQRGHRITLSTDYVEYVVSLISNRTSQNPIAYLAKHEMVHDYLGGNPSHDHWAFDACAPHPLSL